MQVIKEFGNQLHGIGFAAAKIYVSGNRGSHGVKFGFGFINHLHNFLSAAPEEYTLLSQGNGVIGTDKKFLSQFVFKIHKLT